jgi:hypothetical protein
MGGLFVLPRTLAVFLVGSHRRRKLQVVVLGGGSFGTAMAAQVAAKKPDLEVAMLLRDDLVCRSINHHHVNWWAPSFDSLLFFTHSVSVY